MNPALWLPRLAGTAREFQFGDDTNPESTHVALRANGSCSFQVNAAGGEYLVNTKHPQLQ
jgi:hypothetical protein